MTVEMGLSSLESPPAVPAGRVWREATYAEKSVPIKRVEAHFVKTAGLIILLENQKILHCCQRVADATISTPESESPSAKGARFLAF